MEVKTVKVVAVIPVLVQVIREQDAQIEDLKKEIEALQSKACKLYYFLKDIEKLLISRY
ncbi:hypothetical protein WFZ85_08750 [Flavobacterium sp. j3]|uniref:Uncharacterized protein n=1 Tax=Flavobacterium aureirubrum TaxID=3133147 RepID=A0ABU9N7I0_9FLAO